MWINFPFQALFYFFLTPCFTQKCGWKDLNPFTVYDCFRGFLGKDNQRWHLSGTIRCESWRFRWIKLIAALTASFRAGFIVEWGCSCCHIREGVFFCGVLYMYSMHVRIHSGKTRSQELQTIIQKDICIISWWLVHGYVLLKPREKATSSLLWS